MCSSYAALHGYRSVTPNDASRRAGSKSKKSRTCFLNTWLAAGTSSLALALA